MDGLVADKQGFIQDFELGGRDGKKDGKYSYTYTQKMLRPNSWLTASVLFL